MRRRMAVWGGVAIVTLTGCDTTGLREYLQDNAMAHDPVHHIERVNIDVVVEPDGALVIDQQYTFGRPTGGVVGMPQAPPLTTLTELTVDGVPLQPDGDELTVASRQATVRYRLTDVPIYYADGTVLEWELWSPPSSYSRQDPEIPVTVTIHTPGAVDAVWWHTKRRGEARIDSNSTILTGELLAWARSTVTIFLPVGALTAVPDDLWHDQRNTSKAVTEARLAEAAAQDASLQRTLTGQDQQWLIYLAGILVGPLLLVVAMINQVFKGNINRRRRLAAMHNAPHLLAEPPGDDDPALVAMLLGGGRKMNPLGMSATALDLAHRRVVVIEGLGAGRWTMRVPSGPARTANDAEAAVFGALQRATGDDRTIVGPPLWPAGHKRLLTRAWIRYRRDAVHRGVHAGLAEHGLKLLVFRAYLPALLLTTWPFWLAANRHPERLWILALAAIVGQALLFPLRRRILLTDAGWRRRLQWEAFGNHLRQNPQLDEQSAAGVLIWGPFLTYGVMLGAGETAEQQVSVPLGGGGQ